MNISKLDNGYMTSYSIDSENKSDWNATVDHKFAFTNWTDLVDWVSKNEDKVLD